MKRRIWVPVLLFLLILVSVLAVRWYDQFQDDRAQELEQYCKTINEQIKEEDFYTARISDGVITLKDRNGTIVGELPFEGYDKKTNRQLTYIQKDEGLMCFFVGGGSGGIMIVNDASDDIMQGINHLERFGMTRGTYWFDTMAS